MIIFTLHLSALVVLSWFVARRVYESSLDKILATFVLVWSNTVFTALFLSCISLLGDRVWYFRTSILMAGLFALCSRIFIKRPLPSIYREPAENDCSTRLKWLRRFVIGSFIVAFGLNLFICLKYSPNNWDSLTYHLPRIHFYLSQGHLGHFDTINLRQIFFPFNATLFQAFLVIYGQSDKLLNCFNLLCWMLASAAVYALSRRCGVNHTASLVAAWIGAFSGQVFAQATATTNDLLAAAPLLAGTVFAIDWWRERGWLLSLLSAGAFGLAFGTKLTMVFFAPGALILLCVWVFRLLQQKQSFSIGKREGLQIITAVLLVILLTVPFLAINYYYTKQLSPEHYSYLLNRPFSIVSFLQTIYTYSIALLLDPVQYFAIKADSAWKFRLAVEPTLRKVLFPFWNREHAVNDLYVFGTDISEDGVFFGFSILLLTWAFLCSLIHPKLRSQRSILLALAGIGWFLTYTAVSKWSLFNQRYFIAAFLLCLPLVGQLFQLVQSQPRSWKRNAAFGFFGFVMITSLLFSYSYLFYNTPRGIKALGKQQFNHGKIGIPPVMESVLAGQKKIRFVFSGYTHEDERLYQFMNRAKDQRFSIGQQRAENWYNVFSFWAASKQSMYSNIPSSSAYTFFAIPGKSSPGVTKLGEFGDGMNRYHYYGISLPNHGETLSENNSNILVRTLFDRFAATKDMPLESRLRSFRLEVIGLNPQDMVKMQVFYSDSSDRNILLTETTKDFSALFTVAEAYKRLYFKVTSMNSKKVVAESEIRIDEFGHPNLSVKKNVGETNWDFIVEPHPSGVVIEGLGPPEGPYVQWELPHVRWAKDQRVLIAFAINEAEKKKGPLRLNLSFRPQVRKTSRMDVIFNGIPLKTYIIHEDKKWIDDTLMLSPGKDRNELEFRISGMSPEERPPGNSLYMLFRELSIRTVRQHP